MMNRYGLGIAGIALGMVIMWGLFGFKNPFKKSNGATAEGSPCTTADMKAGTVKNGVCTA